jgi:aspartate/methionine/tyrosine aminotransferase
VALSNRTAWNREPNALSLRRAELERAGRRLIDLTVSNPTEAGLSPRGVGLPAVDVYAPEPLGLRTAREAVARWLGCAPEQVVLSASTSEAYAWLFKLLCNPGDEVLVPAPCYPLLDHLAQLEDVALRRYPLRYDGRWSTDAHALEGSPRTRAVVAVSPGNPTGTYLAPDEARALSERGWPLIVDEVFADPARSVMRQKLPGVAFGLGGLSKAAGLPQLKLAWTAVQGPSEVLERLELIADTYLSVSSPVQAAAQSLLQLDFRARVAERCATNRAQLQRLDPSWTLLNADAGWTAVLRVPEHPGEEERCLALLERGVVVHPGYFYDFPSGAHLVLSLLPETQVFAEGVARLTAR